MTGATRADGVVATKVLVPRLPHGAVTRPRLLDRLDEAVARPLTLVVAAAGWGKTVLLSEWAASMHAQGPVAWVALDADDAHPRRFWGLVLQALTAAGVSGAVESLEVPARAPVGTLVPALANALNGDGPPVVLVLDDFHDVASAVAPDVQRLLRHPAERLRLVLASRMDPPLRLGRLRSGDEVGELHAADLACTIREAEALLERFGANAGGEGVRRLWAHTEGWPAGLRLAAASLRSHSDAPKFIDEFTGENAAVSDYLVSEVLARQPDELRKFLLRTSVVDTLDATLAEALSGRDDGRRVLEALERAGVPASAVDNNRRWYRYHGMFAEFLRTRLQLELPGEVAGLHARAAKVYARRGDQVGALRHAVEGQVWALAARIIALRGVAMILQGGIEAIAPLAGSLPPSAERHHPELSLALAALSLERGDQAAAEASLERALAAEANAGDAESFRILMTLVRLQLARMNRDFTQTSLLAEDLVEHAKVTDEWVADELRSFALSNVGIAAMWSGDLDAAVLALEQALAAARHAESDWPTMVACGYLALVADFRGASRDMDRRAREAVAIAERRGWMTTWPVTPALQMLAYAAADRLELDEAEQLLEQARRSLGTSRRLPLGVVHRTVHALILEARGRFDEALDETRAARDGARELPDGHPFLTGLEQLEARLLISRGDLQAARKALQLLGDSGGLNPGVLAERARLELLEGDPVAARATVAPALDDESAGFAHLPAHAWLVEALAAEAQGDASAADKAIARAIEILAGAGVLRSLTLYGPALSPVLKRRRRDVAAAHSELVAQALTVLERRGASAPAAALEEVLTDRELQVLVYLPTMLSTSEIAAQLCVSPNTVRTHLKSIYRKLGVHRRTAAVDRARQLQLLEPSRFWFPAA